MKKLNIPFGIFALALSLTATSAMAQTVRKDKARSRGAKSAQDIIDEQTAAEEKIQKAKQKKVDAIPMKGASVRKVETEIEKIENEQDALKVTMNTYPTSVFAQRLREEAAEDYQKNKVKIKSLENLLPAGKGVIGFTAEIGQDSYLLKDGKGKVDLSLNAVSRGIAPVVRPSDKIDFSLPIIYRAEAGAYLSSQSVSPPDGAPSTAVAMDYYFMNLGANADVKVAPELAVAVGKRSHIAAGPFAGLSTEFAVDGRANATPDGTDVFGNPINKVNTYSKGNGDAAFEYGLSAGISDPNVTLRAIFGKGNIFAATPELELGENNLKTYDLYGAQFMIKDRVQGDISAKVFNGDGNAIYKGSIYARVGDGIWVGGNARVMDVTNAVTGAQQSVTSVRAGVQITTDAFGD